MTAPAKRSTMQLISDMTANLRTGLCVLRGELLRLCSGGFRSIEARQLRRRLDEEHAALGRRVAELLAEGEAASSGEVSTDATVRELLGRTAFLRDELTRHAAGADADRQRQRARLTRQCGCLDKPDA